MRRFAWIALCFSLAAYAQDIPPQTPASTGQSAGQTPDPTNGQANGQTTAPAKDQTAPAPAAAPSVSTAQPTAQAAAAPPPPAAAPAGTEWITGSVDIGYRFVTGIAGSDAAYRSMVDLGQGPRLLGLNATIEDPTKRFFDRLTISGMGWGGDPYTTAHVDAVKHRVYRFVFDYRNIAYFNALPTFANPFAGNGIFLDQESFDIRKRMANFELELRPGTRVVPYLQYSRDSDHGTGVTDFVSSANESYPVANFTNEHTDNYRGGVRIEFPKFHVTLEEGATVFQDNEQVSYNGLNTGNLPGPYFGETLDLTNLLQAYGIRGTNPYTRALLTATPASCIDIFGQFSYSMGQTNVNYTQSNAGEFVNLSSLLFYTSEQDLLMGAAKQPHTSGTGGFEMRPLKRVRLVESWTTDRLHTASSSELAQALVAASSPITEPLSSSTFRLVDNYSQQSFDIFYDLTSYLTLRGGERYTYGDTTVPPFYGAGFETGKLSRQAGVGGISLRVKQKLSANFNFEGGDSGQTYYLTSLQNYRQYRARVRYQPINSLSITWNLNALNNNNPIPGVNYRFSSKDDGVSLLWTAGKRFSLLGDYARTTVYSDILYIVPQTFTSAQSNYWEDAHQASALADFKMLAIGSRVLHLSAGGALFTGHGSRPTRFYQPMAKLTFPLANHVDWNTQWSWYGFNEPSYPFEGFRSTVITTGLRLTR